MRRATPEDVFNPSYNYPTTYEERAHLDSTKRNYTAVANQFTQYVNNREKEGAIAAKKMLDFVPAFEALKTKVYVPPVPVVPPVSSEWKTTVQTEGTQPSIRVLKFAFNRPLFTI